MISKSTKETKTSYNHITVRTRDRPRKYFSFSIHAPGRGNRPSVVGARAVSRNGKESPIPIKKKMRKILNVEVVKAKVRAVPRKGAEQGVERIVVKAPEKKSPMRPSLNSAEPSLDPPGVTNSKSPKRFKERTKIMSIITRINPGD